MNTFEERRSRARLTKARSALQDFQGRSTQIHDLREQLLDELNHRLKNNLQILHGLLLIALHKTDNSEAREVLFDTSRRIGAMGTAQQVFYSVHDSTDVSGPRLIEAVRANARSFFSKEVSINYEATTASLPKESAVPLALALNELLTNAAKHGADDRGRVTINVGLSQRSGEIELHVHDRGSGFNLAEIQGRMSGLGLVTTLAERLKGTFTVERRSGARCTLRFPDQ
jgi:two-component sensor histidine kinase